jgi:hypothetical protein
MSVSNSQIKERIVPNKKSGSIVSSLNFATSLLIIISQSEVLYPFEMFKLIQITN